MQPVFCLDAEPPNHHQLKLKNQFVFTGMFPTIQRHLDPRFGYRICSVEIWETVFFSIKHKIVYSPKPVPIQLPRKLKNPCKY